MAETSNLEDGYVEDTNICDQNDNFEQKGFSVLGPKITWL